MVRILWMGKHKKDKFVVYTSEMFKEHDHRTISSSTT